MFDSSSFGFIKDIKEAFSPRVSESVKNETTLDTLRKAMAEDRKYVTRHPILKHLFLRYEAILNDITEFGLPQARIEPAKEFSERVNQLTVDIANKENIKRRKIRSRASSRNQQATRKEKGKNYYGRTNQ